MKVLIIEDSERLLHSLGRGLTKAGYAVDLAADGKTGVAFAETHDYDAIVLDLMLPFLSGLEVLCRLRKGGQDTHILILSAKDRSIRTPVRTPTTSNCGSMARRSWHDRPRSTSMKSNPVLPCSEIPSGPYPRGSPIHAYPTEDGVVWSGSTLFHRSMTNPMKNYLPTTSPSSTPPR